MPATSKNFTATEIRAGLLVVVSIVILLAFIAAIRGCRPHDENARRFTATFTDIGGLDVHADVRFGGVRVGRVLSITPDADDRTKIRVTAEVDGDIPVNRGSIASIQQVSLTADKHLEISTGEADAPLLADGDTLVSRDGSGGLFDMPNLDGVTTRLESLLDSITVLVGGKPHGGPGGGVPSDTVDLADVLATLQATLTDSGEAARDVSTLIADNRAGIGEVVTKLAALEESAAELTSTLAAVVAENRAPLNSTVLNLSRLTEATSARIEELAASLTAAVRHLEDTGGNLSDLMDDQRPALEEIVRNLSATTANLRRLSEILANQPSALIRGAKPQGRRNGDPQ